MDRHQCGHCEQPCTRRPTRGETPTFVPRIDTSDVFREMIADEIRNGRLSTARRRRIVRYAAGLKMSAVEAGRLIDGRVEDWRGDP